MPMWAPHQVLGLGARQLGVGAEADTPKLHLIWEGVNGCK